MSKDTRKLQITVADDRYDRGLRVTECTWAQLAKRLSKYKKTKETLAEYAAMDPLDQLQTKDVGWFIGGPMSPVERRKANLQHRDVVTLDADHVTDWEVDAFLSHWQQMSIAGVIHSSHKHTDDEPRLRVVLALDSPCPPELYEPLARGLANTYGDMDVYDDTTFQASRVMFWPSCSSDAEPVFVELAGKPLHWRSFLESCYGDDADDWGLWPTSSREQITRDPGKKAEDPYTKPGIIGAFNRVYHIPYAIEHFELPYELSGMGDNRYSHTGGTSRDGAIYYEDDGHLYSWHESDPARGNRNAWDLVRLHRFGHLDADAGADTPINELPSQKAMVAFAAGDSSVARELTADDFEDLGAGEDGTVVLPGSGGGDDVVHHSELTYDAIIAAIGGHPRPIDNAFRQTLVTRIAAAKLSPGQVSVLAGSIKASHGDPAPTKASIEAEIKQRGRELTARQAVNGEITDIEQDIMVEVLREHFAGGAHIRRFAKQFWVYEGGLWTREEDDRVRGRLQETIVRLRVDRPEEVMNLVAAVGETTTSGLLSKLWVPLCAYVSRLDNSQDPMRLMEQVVDPVVNCMNCEITFAGGKVRRVKHRPEEFHTSQIPLAFDPEADTSHWDSFCDLMFHDSLEPDEMQRHLEEVGGYIIQNWRELPTIMFMKGQPAAGKSTFGQLLTELMGKAAVNVSMERYEGGNDHATAGLVGKLLVLDEDFRAGGLLPDGFLKKVSEAKRVTANPKGKDEFEFVARSLPLIISNGWPSTRDHSGALERRLLAWDLSTIPVELQDNHARRMLLTEGLPGVLLAFVRGFARLYARGHWAPPHECVVAAQRWSRMSDNVSLWLSEVATRVPDRGSFVSYTDAYSHFRRWSMSSTPDARVPKARVFQDRVRESALKAGFDIRDKVVRGTRGWGGFTLAANFDSDFDELD